MLLSKGTVASVHSLSTTCTWKGRIRLAAIRGAVLLRQGREGSFCSSQGVAGQGSTTAAGMHGRSSSAGGLSQPANKLTGQFTPHALNTREYRCAPVADQAVSNKRVLFDEGAHLRAVSIAKCRVPCFGGRAVGQGQASSSRAEDHDGACPLLPQLECEGQHKAARMPALPHLILIGSPPDQHSAAQQAQQACHAARFCCSNQGVAGSAGRHCAVLVSTTHCTGLLLSRAPGGTAARELHKLAGFKISTFKLTPNWFQDPACLSIGLPTAPHSSSLPASACVAEYSWQASPFNGALRQPRGTERTASARSHRGVPQGASQHNAGALPRRSAGPYRLAAQVQVILHIRLPLGQQLSIVVGVVVLKHQILWPHASS